MELAPAPWVIAICAAGTTPVPALDAMAGIALAAIAPAVAVFASLAAPNMGSM